MKKIGIVFSGGGSKAFAFHIGVIKALEDENFSFRHGTVDSSHSEIKINDREISLFVGSSSGSAIVAFLVSGHSSADMLDALMMGKNFPKMSRKHIIPFKYRIMNRIFKFSKECFRGNFNLDNLNPFPFLDGHAIEKYFRKHILLENEFNKYKADIFIPATQLNSSRKVIFSKINSAISETDKYCEDVAYYNDVPVSKAIAASCSFPFFFRPFGIRKKDKYFHYYDGVLKDTSSVHIPRDFGCDLAILSSGFCHYKYDRNYGDLADKNVLTHVTQAMTHLMEQKTADFLSRSEKNKDIFSIIEEVADKNHPEYELLLRNIKTSLKVSDIDYLSISPKTDDYDFLFGQVASDNPDILREYFHLGYERGRESIKEFFSSKKKDRIVGKTQVIQGKRSS